MDVKSHLISVIIPAYNADRFIKESIESVLSQSFKDFELIIVDDGSKDDTKEIIDEFIHLTNIKYIYQENTGVSAARNTGAQLAKGEYLVFLDADDILMPHCLEKRLQKIENSDFGLVHNDMQTVRFEDNSLGEVMFGREGFILDDLLLWEGCSIPTPSSIMVKRKVYEEVGGFHTALSNNADQEWFFRVASKYKIGRIPEPLTYYRIHANNMHSNVELLESDSITSYNLAKENKLFKSKIFEKQCFSNMYLIVAANLIGSHNVGNKLRAVKYLLRGIFLYPPNFRKVVKKIAS